MFLVFLVSLAGKALLAQSGPDIPPGKVEIARERIGDTIVIYVGSPKQKERFDACGARIKEIDADSEEFRRELEEAEKQTVGAS